MQRNKFIVHSSEREEVGVAQGWGYLWIENINDRKDKIRQSLGIQDTALSCVTWPPQFSAQWHTDWYRIRISPAPVIIAALHYGKTKTVLDCTLRTHPVSGGKVSPRHTNIRGSRFSINGQECKWLLNFAPTTTSHSEMSLTPAPQPKLLLSKNKMHLFVFAIPVLCACH